MTPVTIRKIVRDIRHERAKLTERETWAKAQEPSAMRAETFREINFWREVYAEAEVTLGLDSGK